jgi:uncharacterized membrane protein YeaQ/YmgE (transglycosylase-associated protein family)
MAFGVIAVIVGLVLLLAVLGAALSALISIVVVGAIIGGLARLVLPGAQNVGIFMTILLGWIGSIVGEVIGHHVLHVGWALTSLVEIGAAAALIGVVSAANRPTMIPPRRPW